MTREKAMQILSTRDAHGVLCGYTSGVTEALDMAIEALSKPTCKKCIDLISKEDAIQKFKIHKFYGKEGDVEFRREEIEAIHHAINSIPLREAIPCEIADKVGEENERLTDRIGQLEEQMRWIPVREKLPSEETFYLCCNKGYLPFTAHYYSGQWHDFDGTTPHVDAWQPLPTPYKGGDDE